MKLSALKIIIIAIVLNALENVTLLYFFGSPIFSKQVIIGSVIFAISLYFITKFIEDKIE